MKAMIIDYTKSVRSLADHLEEYNIVFVTREGKLVGSVTNGDFRRAITSGVSLDQSVTAAMHKRPKFAYEDDGYKKRKTIIDLLPNGLKILPILNRKNRIVDVVSDSMIIKIPNLAIIMAGGLGSRLKQLTEHTPKPMLKIGERPILQILIEQLKRSGISKYIISVNYKKEIIQEFFKDGADFGVSIQYLVETERLGTAGCLSLLENSPENPFIVMNGDVLSEVNAYDLINHHCKSGCLATMCTKEYRSTIPYGVIKTRQSRLASISEKPQIPLEINAGIYVLDPVLTKRIPKGKSYDMTTLISSISECGDSVSCYKLPGLWADIGNIEDFIRASMDFTSQCQSNS